MMAEVTNADEIVRNVAATRNQSAQFSFLASWGTYCQTLAWATLPAFSQPPNPSYPDTGHREHNPNNKRSKRRSRGNGFQRDCTVDRKSPIKAQKVDDERIIRPEPPSRGSSFALREPIIRILGSSNVAAANRKVMDGEEPPVDVIAYQSCVRTSALRYGWVDWI